MKKPTPKEKHVNNPAVAFILNQAKSEFYHAWGQELEKIGIPVFYISPSPRWSRWMRAQGVAPERLLNLSDLETEWHEDRVIPEEDLDLLRRAEAAGPLSVASMILMDRTLNRWPQARALAYAASVGKAIDAYLRKHAITTVLGETTWLVELLGAQIAAATGGRFYAPSTARIPSERLVFFEGPVQRSFLRLREIQTADLTAARQQIQELESRKPQPYYMALRTPIGHQLRHFLSEAVLHLMRRKETTGDISVQPLHLRISNQLKQRRNRRTVARAVAFETPDLPASAPYVYLTLHKQPEASVDVLGAPYVNQLENIRALSRLLPVGYELWVKEHKSALGDRAPRWYEALRNIPGVRLISPQADGFSIMRSAQLTVSPSGTASFEAGVLGHRSVCFAPMYFSDVLHLKQFDPFAMDKQQFQELLTAPAPSRETREVFLAHIFANSFAAVIGDPIGDPSCLEPDNLMRLAEATRQVHALSCPPGQSSADAAAASA